LAKIRQSAVEIGLWPKLIFLNIASVRHLEFKSFEFWLQDFCYRPNNALPYKISSKSDIISLKCRDIAIITWRRWRSSAILDFQIL